MGTDGVAGVATYDPVYVVSVTFARSVVDVVSHHCRPTAPCPASPRSPRSVRLHLPAESSENKSSSPSHFRSIVPSHFVIRRKRKLLVLGQVTGHIRRPVTLGHAVLSLKRANRNIRGEKGSCMILNIEFHSCLI